MSTSWNRLPGLTVMQPAPRPANRARRFARWDHTTVFAVPQRACAAVTRQAPAEVEYEWDEAKAATNFGKHGVSFTAAAQSKNSTSKVVRYPRENLRRTKPIGLASKP